MQHFIMNAQDLLTSRQQDWQTLEKLLEVANKDAKRLAPEQVRLMGALYRGVTSDLALAQRDFPDDQVTVYLNQLVARAHATIYQGEPLAVGRLWRFVTHGFPKVFRETAVFTLVAALLFIVPAVITALVANNNPETAQWILPVQVQQLIPIIEDQELWVDMEVSERPFMSSAIMTNNIRVSFLAFAGGMLAGLFTVFVMINNGLLLGGLTGLTAHYGIGFELWTFVIGHGVVELSVIFMAGGAGLMLGWAMLRPGLLTRRDAIQVAAQKAVRLIVGCVPLLVIAGLIEGFISPAESLHWGVKWGVGIGSGVVLYGYLFLAGRKD